MYRSTANQKEYCSAREIEKNEKRRIFFGQKLHSTCMRNKQRLKHDFIVFVFFCYSLSFQLQ